jgi:hypothetical protein
VGAATRAVLERGGVGGGKAFGLGGFEAPDAGGRQKEAPQRMSRGAFKFTRKKTHQKGARPVLGSEPFNFVNHKIYLAGKPGNSAFQSVDEPDDGAGHQIGLVAPGRVAAVGKVLPFEGA